MLYPYFDLNERPVEPPTTPPRINAAHQVSKPIGMLRAGNNVFNDQIVATGTRISRRTTNPIINKYFIV
jgi:protein involved in ribonucleotide reduction